MHIKKNELPAYFFFIVAFIINVWYQLVPGKWIVDSDLATEFILAKQLNSEKAILSPNWFYGNELKVFLSQWFYRIGLLISPNNWHIARAVGALLVLMVMAYFFCSICRQLDLSFLSLYAASMLILPFGFWHLFLTLYSPCYAIYIIFSLAILICIYKSIYLRHINLYWLAILLLSFMTGLNGIRQAFSLFVPLCTTSILLTFISSINCDATDYKSWKEKVCEELSFLIHSILSTVGWFCGYAINNKFLRKSFQFKSYEELAFDNAYNTYGDVLRSFFTLFGFQTGAKVFSLNGICSMLGIVVAILIILSSIRLLSMFNTLSFKEKVAAILFPVTLIVQSTVFVFLGNYEPNYWLSTIPFAILSLFIWIKNESFPFTQMRSAFLWFILAITCICSIGTIKSEIETPLRGVPGLYDVAEWLKKEGYSKGVATFWNAGSLSFMTDGNIDMYSVAYLGADNGWDCLQSKDKFNLPENDFILIVNTNKDEDISYVTKWNYNEFVKIYAYAGIEVYYYD